MLWWWKMDMFAFALCGFFSKTLRSCLAAGLPGLGATLGAFVAQLASAACERRAQEAMWRRGPISRTPNRMECRGFLSRTSCFIWIRMPKSFLEQLLAFCWNIHHLQRRERVVCAASAFNGEACFNGGRVRERKKKKKRTASRRRDPAKSLFTIQCSAVWTTKPVSCRWGTKAPGDEHSRVTIWSHDRRRRRRKTTRGRKQNWGRQSDFVQAG